MNNYKFLSDIVGLLALGFISCISVSYAHDDEEHTHSHSKHKHESGHEHTHAEPQSEAKLLTDMHNTLKAASDSIASKQLGAIHDQSEILTNASKNLASQARAKNNLRAEGLLNNLNSLADRLHQSADNNDQSSAETSLNKINAIMPLIDQHYNFKFEDYMHAHKVNNDHPHGQKCDLPDVSVTIHSKQFSFDPKEIRVKSGQKVCLRLTSEDVEHGIMIENYNVHVHGAKEKPGEVQFLADKLGRFKFICHQVCGEGHSKMQGELVVD